MGHSSATHEAGHEFNKYRLREPISESFLGTRYRAVSNTPANLRAASNAFGSGAGTRSSAFALRLLRAQSSALIDCVARAAKAVRYLDHVNVLAPIQLIRAQTRLGVITQDVDGYTLSALLRLASARGEALPQAITLRIALDVLEGLEALHATENNVQRYEYACGGLTPDSIHIGKDGRTRLIDPGVAGAAAALPFWGHDPVALAYTAPEQSGAEPSFNPCSDVFSIGVMLWEMLAGRSLFGAPTAAETLERLHKSTIPRVQRQHFVRGEPISAAVAQLVGHALQREAALRYPSCRELTDALRSSAEIASHADIVEHCHRLAGSSAGVFEAAPPVAPLRSMRAPIFEISKSLAPPPPESGERGSQPPSFFTEAERNAPPAPEQSGLLPADLFEPQTARMAPPASQPLPPPPVLPEPLPTHEVVPGAITAFPISDFIPSQRQSRRNYAPIAVAAAVLLGLSYLIWHETTSRSRSAAALPTTAARPVTSIVPTPSSSPPAAPNTPTVTTESTSSPIAGPVVITPAPQPSVQVEPVGAQGASNKRSDAARRRSTRTEPATNSTDSASDPSSTPFIPDDI